jgi:malate dehydrogenase
MMFFRRFYSSSASSTKYKVSVLGAAGGIGQPLSLLLKTMPDTYPLIHHLALYDLSNMGMSVDLSHIPTPVKVTGHSGKESLPEALKGSNVVIIPAGVPRKPGMTRDDLFNVNASIVKELAQACAAHCPNAHLLVISNPVNSTVPIAYEVLKKAGISNPSVIGVTTLDVIRAQTFIGEMLSLPDPTKVKVNVIGGHSGPTIVPLFSSSQPVVAFKSEEDAAAILKRVQYGGDEVVLAKNGGGSATLSMAQAANLFTQKFLRALQGEKGIVENAFVYSEQWKDVKFMAGLIEFGKNGVEKIHALPKFNEKETGWFNTAITTLKGDIQKGLDFASKQ